MLEFVCFITISESMKYTVKEKLEIAESVVTIIMFVMAVWGSIIAYEEQFWHKLNHVVNHYHEEISKQESSDCKDHAALKQPKRG